MKVNDSHCWLCLRISIGSIAKRTRFSTACRQLADVPDPCTSQLPSRFCHAWNNQSFYSQLRVDPLQPTSAQELLQHLFGPDKDLVPLKELLAERTVGNPFFAEESVRSLVEEGVLLGEKGAYRPSLKIDEIRIPSTVQNVVADRIDRLSIAEKHLLQTAAVIGVIVPLPLLRAVAGLPEDELQGQLAHLQAAEFLYESNLFPQLEYKFKHALTNEVAYGALLHERKTSLHAKIVSALEKSVTDNLRDHIETLAHHAYQGEIWEKAVGYSWQAGGKARNVRRIRKHENFSRPV